jgi:acyl-CoA reductase-like NAD-dependent aldehyde dehydrogenase
VAPALAAGCTIVIKPASYTPAATYELVELIHETGLPKGVVNLVPGGEITYLQQRLRSELTNPAAAHSLATTEGR